MEHQTQQTYLVRIHLQNDVLEHSRWTQRYREIYNNIPESLSHWRAEYVEEDEEAKHKATQRELGREIKDHFEDAVRFYHEQGVTDFKTKSCLPDLLKTILDGFVEDVDWVEVAESFTDPDLEEDLSFDPNL